MKKSVLTRIVVVTLSLVLISGCAFMGQKNVDVSGRKISNKTLAGFTIGETTKHDLIAALGAPTSSHQEDNDVEILSYTYHRTTKDNSAVIFIWAIQNETTEHETAYFKLQNDVLVDFWTDKG